MKLNINNKSRGFTIVELLVVIVVIGILAAITMVSYSGVTAKAYTATSQSNAQSVQGVAEIMNAENGYYPDTLAHLLAGQNTAGTAGTTKIPTGITLVGGTLTQGSELTSTTATKGTTVTYQCISGSCATGGRIAYWDFTSNSIKYYYIGAATSANTFAGI